MLREWRLILSPPASGAWNIGLDEAILFSTAQKNSPPTLRMYAWQPATLSLGFAQPHLDVDLAALEEEQWGLVRRPTGGRAILHVDELTYAVAGSDDEPFLAGGLLESYCKISRALLTGLARMNVTAFGDKAYTNEPPDNKKNPVCFETPSNYEITVDGKKLIGSAQSRKYGGILQHGSIPIKGDLARITRVLQFPSEQARQTAANRLIARASTLEAVMGTAPSMETVAEAVITGFSKAGNIHFSSSQPSEQELKMAAELVSAKYGSAQWTFRI